MLHMVTFLLYHAMVIPLETHVFWFNVLKLNTSTLLLTNKTLLYALLNALFSKCVNKIGLVSFWCLSSKGILFS